MMKVSQKPSCQGKTPAVMNSTEYLELKERMDRIEEKLDQFLGLNNRALKEPVPLPTSFQQRFDDMLADEARNRARRAERERIKAEKEKEQEKS
jgi:hypothetical protein